MLLLWGTVAGVMGVIQAFRFGFLAAVNDTFNVSYTFNATVGAVALILSIPSDSGDPRRDRSCLFRVQENQELPHFQGISQKPLRPLPSRCCRPCHSRGSRRAYLHRFPRWARR